MNKIYKVVWSKVRNCYVVVSEVSKNIITGGVKSAKVGNSPVSRGLALGAAMAFVITGSAGASIKQDGGVYNDGNASNSGSVGINNVSNLGTEDYAIYVTNGGSVTLTGDNYIVPEEHYIKKTYPSYIPILGGSTYYEKVNNSPDHVCINDKCVDEETKYYDYITNIITSVNGKDAIHIDKGNVNLQSSDRIFAINQITAIGAGHGIYIKNIGENEANIKGAINSITITGSGNAINAEGGTVNISGTNATGAINKLLEFIEDSGVAGIGKEELAEMLSGQEVAYNSLSANTGNAIKNSAADVNITGTINNVSSSGNHAIHSTGNGNTIIAGSVVKDDATGEITTTSSIWNNITSSGTTGDAIKAENGTVIVDGILNNVTANGGNAINTSGENTVVTIKGATNNVSSTSGNAINATGGVTTVEGALNTIKAAGTGNAVDASGGSVVVKGTNVDEDALTLIGNSFDNVEVAGTTIGDLLKYLPEVGVNTITSTNGSAIAAYDKIGKDSEGNDVVASSGDVYVSGTINTITSTGVEDEADDGTKTITGGDHAIEVSGSGKVVVEGLYNKVEATGNGENKDAINAAGGTVILKGTTVNIPEIKDDDNNVITNAQEIFAGINTINSTNGNAIDNSGGNVIVSGTANTLSAGVESVVVATDGTTLIGGKVTTDEDDHITGVGSSVMNTITANGTNANAVEVSGEKTKVIVNGLTNTITATGGSAINATGGVTTVEGALNTIKAEGGGNAVDASGGSVIVKGTKVDEDALALISNSVSGVEISGTALSDLLKYLPEVGINTITGTNGSAIAVYDKIGKDSEGNDVVASSGDVYVSGTINTITSTGVEDEADDGTKTITGGDHAIEVSGSGKVVVEGLYNKVEATGNGENKDAINAAGGTVIIKGTTVNIPETKDAEGKVITNAQEIFAGLNTINSTNGNAIDNSGGNVIVSGTANTLGAGVESVVVATDGTTLIGGKVTTDENGNITGVGSSVMNTITANGANANAIEVSGEETKVIVNGLTNTITAKVGGSAINATGGVTTVEGALNTIKAEGGGNAIDASGTAEVSVQGTKVDASLLQNEAVKEILSGAFGEDNLDLVKTVVDGLPDQDVALNIIGSDTGNAIKNTGATVKVDGTVNLINSKSEDAVINAIAGETNITSALANIITAEGNGAAIKADKVDSAENANVTITGALNSITAGSGHAIDAADGAVVKVQGTTVDGTLIEALAENTAVTTALQGLFGTDVKINEVLDGLTGNQAIALNNITSDSGNAINNVNADVDVTGTVNMVASTSGNAINNAGGATQISSTVANYITATGTEETGNVVNVSGGTVRIDGLANILTATGAQSAEENTESVVLGDVIHATGGTTTVAGALNYISAAGKGNVIDVTNGKVNIDGKAIDSTVVEAVLSELKTSFGKDVPGLKDVTADQLKEIIGEDSVGFNNISAKDGAAIYVHPILGPTADVNVSVNGTVNNISSTNGSAIDNQVGQTQITASVANIIAGKANTIDVESGIVGVNGLANIITASTGNVINATGGKTTVEGALNVLSASGATGNAIDASNGAKVEVVGTELSKEVKGALVGTDLLKGALNSVFGDGDDEKTTAVEEAINTVITNLPEGDIGFNAITANGGHAINNTNADVDVTGTVNMVASTSGNAINTISGTTDVTSDVANIITSVSGDAIAVVGGTTNVDSVANAIASTNGSAISATGGETNVTSTVSNIISATGEKNTVDVYQLDDAENEINVNISSLTNIITAKDAKVISAKAGNTNVSGNFNSVMATGAGNALYAEEGGTITVEGKVVDSSGIDDFVAKVEEQLGTTIPKFVGVKDLITDEAVAINTIASATGNAVQNAGGDIKVNGTANIVYSNTGSAIDATAGDTLVNSDIANFITAGTTNHVVDVTGGDVTIKGLANVVSNGSIITADAEGEADTTTGNVIYVDGAEAEVTVEGALNTIIATSGNAIDASNGGKVTVKGTDNEKIAGATDAVAGKLVEMLKLTDASAGLAEIAGQLGLDIPVVVEIVQEVAKELNITMPEVDLTALVGKEVAINSITATDGNAIHNDGGSVTVTGTWNNVSAKDDAAIYNESSTTIVESTLINTIGAENGSALKATGGEINVTALYNNVSATNGNAIEATGGKINVTGKTLGEAQRTELATKLAGTDFFKSFLGEEDANAVAAKVVERIDEIGVNVVSAENASAVYADKDGFAKVSGTVNIISASSNVDSDDNECINDSGVAVLQTVGTGNIEINADVANILSASGTANLISNKGGDGSITINSDIANVFTTQSGDIIYAENDITVTGLSNVMYAQDAHVLHAVGGDITVKGKELTDGVQAKLAAKIAEDTNVQAVFGEDNVGLIEGLINKVENVGINSITAGKEAILVDSANDVKVLGSLNTVISTGSEAIRNNNADGTTEIYADVANVIGAVNVYDEEGNLVKENTGDAIEVEAGTVYVTAASNTIIASIGDGIEAEANGTAIVTGLVNTISAGGNGIQADGGTVTVKGVEMSEGTKAFVTNKVLENKDVVNVLGEDVVKAAIPQVGLVGVNTIVGGSDAIVVGTVDADGNMVEGTVTVAGTVNTIASTAQGHGINSVAGTTLVDADIANTIVGAGLGHGINAAGETAIVTVSGMANTIAAAGGTDGAGVGIYAGSGAEVTVVGNGFEGDLKAAVAERVVATQLAGYIGEGVVTEAIDQLGPVGINTIQGVDAGIEARFATVEVKGTMNTVGATNGHGIEVGAVGNVEIDADIANTIIGVGEGNGIEASGENGKVAVSGMANTILATGETNGAGVGIYAGNSAEVTVAGKAFEPELVEAVVEQIKANETVDTYLGDKVVTLAAEQLGAVAINTISGVEAGISANDATVKVYGTVNSVGAVDGHGVEVANGKVVLDADIANTIVGMEAGDGINANAGTVTVSGLANTILAPGEVGGEGIGINASEKATVTVKGKEFSDELAKAIATKVGANETVATYLGADVVLKASEQLGAVAINTISGVEAGISANEATVKVYGTVNSVGAVDGHGVEVANGKVVLDADIANTIVGMEAGDGINANAGTVTVSGLANTILAPGEVGGEGTGIEAAEGATVTVKGKEFKPELASAIAGNVAELVEGNATIAGVLGNGVIETAAEQLGAVAINTISGVEAGISANEATVKVYGTVNSVGAVDGHGVEVANGKVVLDADIANTIVGMEAGDGINANAGTVTVSGLANTILAPGEVGGEGTGIEAAEGATVTVKGKEFSKELKAALAEKVAGIETITNVLGKDKVIEYVNAANKVAINTISGVDVGISADEATVKVYGTVNNVTAVDGHAVVVTENGGTVELDADVANIVVAAAENANAINVAGGIVTVNSRANIISSAKADAVNATGGNVAISGNNVVVAKDDAVYAKDAEVTLTGDTVINAEHAFHVEEGATVKVNAGNAGVLTKVVGDSFVTGGALLADIVGNNYGDSYYVGDVEATGGSVAMSFSGKSIMEGTVVTEGGSTSIVLNDNSVWNVTNDSNVTSLTVEEDTIINTKHIGDHDNNAAYVQVDGHLAGDSAGFVVDFDVANVDNKKHTKTSDYIYLNGSSEGAHDIYVSNEAFKAVYEELHPTNKIFFAHVKEQQAQTFAIADQTVSFGGATFDVKSEYGNTIVGQDRIRSNYINNYKFVVDKEADGKGGNDWYVGMESTGKSASTNMAEAALRAGYALGTEMDRFNKRMGESQFLEGENGLWVRYRHNRVGLEDSFKTSSNMFQIGYDQERILKDSEHHSGVTLDYTDANTSLKEVRGEGDNKRYAVGYYDSWVDENGNYRDIVIRVGKTDSEYNASDRIGSNITSDYDQMFGSISGELGSRKAIGSQWFVEPQAQLQLAYVGSADYRTNYGVEVDESSATSLIGRMGFRIGRDFFRHEDPTKRNSFYFKADLMHEFCGDRDYTIIGEDARYSKEFDGKETWFDVGIGANIAINRATYFWLDAERTFGGDYEKTWQISGGFRWEWK